MGTGVFAGPTHLAGWPNMAMRGFPGENAIGQTKVVPAAGACGWMLVEEMNPEAVELIAPEITR